MTPIRAMLPYAAALTATPPVTDSLNNHNKRGSKRKLQQPTATATGGAGTGASDVNADSQDLPLSTAVRPVAYSDFGE